MTTKHRLTLASLTALLMAPWLLIAAPSVPDFSLLDTLGHNVQMYRAEGKVVVLFFTGVGCPVARKSAAKINELSESYRSKGVSFWIINTYAEDSQTNYVSEIEELRLQHHTILRDPKQLVALALGVERTAEVVAVGVEDHKVIYQGAVDDQLSEGAERPAAKEHLLANALDSYLGGRPVVKPRSQAHGCRITFTPPAHSLEPPSYARDIAPVLRKHCAECHREGGIGPWAMTSHARVKNYAKMIEEVVLTRRMPPYDADPDFGAIAHPPRLTREESQSLLRWVAAGSPRGDGPDPLEAPLPPLQDWPMGKPDVVLRMPAPEQIPATGVLDYRQIPLPFAVTNDLWIGSADIRPGNRRVMHHAILYAKWPGCPDDGSGFGVMVHGWAPGSVPVSWPRGVGKHIPAGAKLSLEAHYTTSGSPQTDLTEVGLYLKQGPQAHNVETRFATDYQLSIPPATRESRHHATYAFVKPATLYRLQPHMHLRGGWMKFELLRPDGKRIPLLNIPRYDFKWQLAYPLDPPMVVPAGSWLLVTGAFDNSSGNPSNPDSGKALRFGLQSWEEMFVGFFDAADETGTP